MKSPVSAAAACLSILAFAANCHAIDEASTKTLTALLQLHREMGLPLPPKTAKLIRYEFGGGGIVNGVRQPATHSLGFLIAPVDGQLKPTFLAGINRFESYPPQDYKEIPATESAARDTPSFYADTCLATQCFSLGWADLAADILKRSRKGSDEEPEKQILFQAWLYWNERLMEPKSDRKPVLAMLKKLRKLDPDQADRFEADMRIRSLELALVPGTAKPGSVQALIDGLVDATVDGLASEETPEVTPYQKLVWLGFDAVPTLLEHLEDARLTRTIHHGMWKAPSRDLKVGDLVCDILKKLAGNDESQIWRTRIIDETESQSPFVKSDVLAWWRVAQKIGEEAYLVKHAVNPEKEMHGTRTPQSSRENQIEVIAKKYPKNLEKVYRAILDKQPLVESYSIVRSILTSSLSSSEKVRLLLMGAVHRDLGHRQTSLWALKKFDRKLSAAILVKTLDSFSGKPAEPYWKCPEASMTSLVVEVDDETAWQALDRLARRADVGLRAEILSNCANAESRSNRRLLFLVGFLEDREVRDAGANAKLFDGPFAMFTTPKIEVRNLTARALASILDSKIRFDGKWQAEDWARYRIQIRNLLREKGIITPEE